MPRKASSSGGRASKIARTDEAEDVTQSAGAKLPPSPTHAAAGAGGKGKGGGKKGKAAVEESSAAAAEAHPSHAHGHRGGSAAALEAKSASSSSSSSALAAIPPAPIKAIVYTLKHPKADTVGEYRKEAAKRYNVPAENVTIRLLDGSNPSDDTNLLDITQPVCLLVKEASGRHKLWTVAFASSAHHTTAVPLDSLLGIRLEDMFGVKDTLMKAAAAEAGADETEEEASSSSSSSSASAARGGSDAGKRAKGQPASGAPAISDTSAGASPDTELVGGSKRSRTEFEEGGPAAAAGQRGGVGMMQQE